MARKFKYNKQNKGKGIGEESLGGKNTVDKERSRSYKTWNRTLEKILLEKGIIWSKAKKLAKNKKEWYKLVYS